MICRGAAPAKLLTSLHSVPQAMQTEGIYSKYALVVLDSVTPLVAPVQGAGSTMQGHAMMILLARQLRACAQQFSLAVLVTNSLLGGA